MEDSGVLALEPVAVAAAGGSGGGGGGVVKPAMGNYWYQARRQAGLAGQRGRRR
jgi:hypothetical protein